MASQPGIVVGLSGKIASGKSTLARGLSEAFEWPYAGAGNYVRSQAKIRGIPETREALQELGEQLLKELGQLEFWKRILEVTQTATDWIPGKPLVVDGVRHVESLECLRQLVTPAEFQLIFVDIDEATRMQRVQKRDQLTDSVLQQRFDKHSTEREISTLKELADIIIGGNQPVDELVKKVSLLLKKTTPG